MKPMDFYYTVQQRDNESNQGEELRHLHFSELDDADENWSTQSKILFLVCPRGSGCLAKEVEVGKP
ncbi:hypothetical protein NC652_019490 [Populus alba x Populus x berolinensis]|nr:hypothetical protein NC652_019490 [Populus alba x Populus x berolinensis]